MCSSKCASDIVSRAACLLGWASNRLVWTINVQRVWREKQNIRFEKCSAWHLMQLQVFHISLCKSLHSLGLPRQGLRSWQSYPLFICVSLVLRHFWVRLLH